MIAVLRVRAALEQIPGGSLIVQALSELVNAINTPPMFCGAVAWHSGTGSPEGVVTGTKGDLYSRRDGGANTSFYVKETGTNSKTGWTAK